MGYFSCIEQEEHMKRTVKILLIAVAVISIIACVLCCLYLYQYFRGNHLNKRIGDQMVTSAAVLNSDGQMRIGVDFDALTAENDEIYAWIEVPGTNISYPVVQSAEDDLYYNSHAVDQSYFSGGSIYSQRYNKTDFSDPMTLLYGHNCRSSYTMFAPLNDFADAEIFKASPYIYIYTPDTVYQYSIFAAYPHSNEHLLLCHDFASEADFTEYFGALSGDMINANFRRELFPHYGDKVITLSTCYQQNRMQRYLVQGVLSAEYTVIKD